MQYKLVPLRTGSCRLISHQGRTGHHWWTHRAMLVWRYRGVANLSRKISGLRSCPLDPPLPRFKIFSQLLAQDGILGFAAKSQSLDSKGLGRFPPTSLLIDFRERLKIPTNLLSSTNTLPESNIAPDNGWLEDDRFQLGWRNLVCASC